MTYSEVMIKRNNTIDFLRFVAAFLVVLIHSPLPGTVGFAIEIAARAAVPFFFMVSGYFSITINNAKIIKRIQRLLFMLIGSCLFYFLWSLISSVLHHNTTEVIKRYISIREWFDTLVLQQGSILGHLWFLLVLILCYVAMFWLKNAGIKLTCGIATGLVFLHYAVKVSLFMLDITDFSYYTRNFLMTGLPMFLIGKVIAELKVKRCDLLKKSYIFAIAVGAVLSLAERILVRQADMYFGSIFLAAGFLLISITYPGNDNKISSLGREYSEYIYIFHVFVLEFVNGCAAVIGVFKNSLFIYCRPIIVLVLSLLLSVAIKLCFCREVLK